jgi:methionine sulfoxide reductase heme-binding subunit
MLRIVLNNKPLLWLILSVPGAMMIYGFMSGRIDAADLLHPSGEFSARLMFLAMMIAPLSALLGRQGWLMWLMGRRRSFGVAAFGYALLHLVLYVIDMETIADMLAEIGALGIWTGWLAFVLMLIPALISNEASVRALRRTWKRVQQLVYPAAILTLVHWIFIHNNLVAALVHFVPLILLWGARFVKTANRPTQGA